MTRLIRTDVTDTNLSQAKPDANVDLIGADGYDAAGNKLAHLWGSAHGYQVWHVGWCTGRGEYRQRAAADVGFLQLRQHRRLGRCYRLTRGFDETTATWNRANATTTAWTTPGGDYDPTALSSSNGFNSDRSGSTGTSPTRCRAVMVLQRLEGLSDRETVERFTFDARWRYAAGVGGWDGQHRISFAHTVLVVDMRQWLRRSERLDRIFEVALAAARQAGLLGRRRMLDFAV